MSIKHLQHICNALNVGVTAPADHTTPANVTARWGIDAAAVLALEEHWQFVPDSAYDPTGVPPPPAVDGSVVVVTGNNGHHQFYFLLTTAPDIAIPIPNALVGEVGDAPHTHVLLLIQGMVHVGWAPQAWGIQSATHTPLLFRPSAHPQAAAWDFIAREFT